MYVYESHLGGLFVEDRMLSFKERFCEDCGDSDVLIGEYSDVQEFWNLIKDYCSIDNSGGYTLSYVFPLMVSLFDLDCDVTYENSDYAAQKFCSNTEENILKQLEKYVGKIEVTESLMYD